ncbi:hypothetical protein COCNU_08G010120 [Cocos nucifera]|uniref:Uncharacterized protein n=1 Tax=Cocos nucifera TaxID=13894 RepID=A0A8K0IIP4_COCNU|nr:hypothetical protein COCNU_08G010120 [Cocos nucifera]
MTAYQQHVSGALSTRETKGGKLARDHTVANLLMGFFEGLAGNCMGEEEDKAIAFAAASIVVDDDTTLLDLVVLVEDRGKDLSGGIPAKAVDEDLTVDGVDQCCGR